MWKPCRHGTLNSNTADRILSWDPWGSMNSTVGLNTTAVIEDEHLKSSSVTSTDVGSTVSIIHSHPALSVLEC
jgi:hypothetical protein